MSHIWMSHVPHMNAPYPRCECVMWVGHVPHMNASRHTYGCVVSRILWFICHVWMSHDPHINTSCPTYICVMPTYESAMYHIWRIHAPLMNVSCHTYKCATPHICTSRPTQAIMYIPFQVNICHKSILRILQYKYLKSCSEDFILKNPTEIWFSAQVHAVLLLLLNIVGFFISARQKSA